jgi:hypothetical protein
MPDKLKLNAEDNVLVALALAHLADNWPGRDTPAKLRELAGRFLRAKQVSITFWPKAVRSKQTEGEINVLPPRRRARGGQDRE